MNLWISTGQGLHTHDCASRRDLNFVPLMFSWRTPAMQAACKPGSVPESGSGDGHSSGARVAACLTRPTRTTGPETGLCRKGTVVPTRSCSRWGLPSQSCRQDCGALLPHPFTLARNRPKPVRRADCSLWHFPWGCPRRTLPGTVFPWSPDFPPPLARKQPPDRLHRH